MYSSIVVGTDGSARAGQAVEEAGRLAKLTGAKLHIVSAYHLPSEMAATMGSEFVFTPPAGDAEALRSVQDLLEGMAKELVSQGISVATYPMAGGAADVLLRVAEDQDADLIVVGSRGMTGARRFLGSVPNNVSHHAHCSVLIVQTTDE